MTYRWDEEDIILEIIRVQTVFCIQNYEKILFFTKLLKTLSFHPRKKLVGLHRKYKKEQNQTLSETIYAEYKNRLELESLFNQTIIEFKLCHIHSIYCSSNSIRV